MKVALLFSGQLRNISYDLFRFSLSNLTKNLDYEIFIHLWDEIGVSMNHEKDNLKVLNKKNGVSLAKKLFKDFNVIKLQSESYLEFKNNLNKKYKEIIDSQFFHFGTVNSAAQIYSISKCFNLISNDLNKYDLIFKCRFDTLFVHPLNLYDLKEFKNSKKIYSINFGRSFFPERIYDIFFGGQKESMLFLGKIWDNFPDLVSDNFDNKLDKRDACRIFYLAAVKEGIICTTFETRICDIFRNINNNFYEKYLISMHLIRLGKIFKNFKVISYFYIWFRLRKLSLFKIIYYLIISFLISPISYLKRSRYFF